jgi:hypothetical protein
VGIKPFCPGNNQTTQGEERAMSKPLERTGYNNDTIAQVHELTSTLNAAIDRINELEAKYESHNHYLGAGFDYAKPTSRAKYPQAIAPNSTEPG